MEGEHYHLMWAKDRVLGMEGSRRWGSVMMDSFVSDAVRACGPSDVVGLQNLGARDDSVFHTEKAFPCHASAYVNHPSRGKTGSKPRLAGS